MFNLTELPLVLAFSIGFNSLSLQVEKLFNITDSDQISSSEHIAEQVIALPILYANDDIKN